MVDQQAAPLCLHLAAVPHELLALARDMASLLLHLGGHADDGQRIAVALHVAVQPQAEGARITPVGLHPAAALIQRLRTDDVTRRSRRTERALQAKAEAAALIDHMHLMTCGEQRADPRHELLRCETPWRSGRGVIVLHHRHVEERMDVESDLDHGTRPVSLKPGSLA